MLKKHYVILGAGISGLALGWYLKQRYQDQISLTILEKSPRAGGWIRTAQHQGVLFEEGPRSCRSAGAGALTLQLVEELGLANQVITAAPAAHRRFLYTEGRLQSIPNGIFSALFSPVTRGLLPALWKELRTPACTNCEESIYDFFARRLSPAIAEKFIDPMISGIYAGDIHSLSLSACLPSLYAWEQKHGSLIKGLLFERPALKKAHSPFVQAMQKASLFSFKDGMETLVKALSRHLQPHLLLNSYATHMQVRPDHIELSLADGQKMAAQHVFMALPAAPALSLLGDSFAALKPFLAPINAASVAVVNLGWQKQELKQQGFGYLIPSKEKQKILGVVWDSSVFPHHNSADCQTRLTVMLGGVRYPEVSEMAPDALLECAQKAVSQQLGIMQAPQFSHVSVAKNAIPQYLVGHAARFKLLEESLAAVSPHLTLLGSAWQGVAVNDCIAKAKEIAFSW